MQTGKFIIVTHLCAQRMNDTGYGWGLLFLNEEDSIYLSRPIERDRIDDVTIVNSGLFDTFAGYSRYRKMTESDRKLMYLWKFDDRSVSVEIPSSYLSASWYEPTVNDNLEAICTYLRGTITDMSGNDTIYKIPKDANELTKDRKIMF